MIALDKLTRGRTRMPQFAVETRCNGHMLALPVLVVLGWLVVMDRLPRIALWADTSERIPQMVALLAPLAGGLSAWVAGREARHGLHTVLRSTAQPAAQRSLTTFAATVIWPLLAYSVVAAGLLGWTALHATWGGPAWWPIMVGLLVVVAGAAVGFAAGSWVPSRFTSPLVATALFVALVAPPYLHQSPLQYLSPLASGLHSDVFWGRWPQVDPWQALWYAGLTASALGVTVLKHTRALVGWITVVSSLAVSGIGATGLLRTPLQSARPAAIPYTAVCAQRSIPICVHPAYQHMLARTAQLVDSVVQPFHSVPGAPIRAEQVAALPPDMRIGAGGTLAFRLEDAVRFDDGWEILVQNTVNMVVVNTMVIPQHTVPLPEGGFGCGDARCEHYYAAGGGRDAQNVVAYWLWQQTGVSLELKEMPHGAYGLAPQLTAEMQAAADRFAALPIATRHAWLVEHSAELRAGRLHVADLP